MKESWVFSCDLGFHQDDCDAYVKDEQLDPFTACFAGCASCVHRIAYNVAEGRRLLPPAKEEEA
ncbi:MAG: hypothetical protein NUV70_01860 [Caldiserica bacterium]|jgi:hypothetical protein|nr:hypothetical protein [Caldisericota bacterium]